MVKVTVTLDVCEDMAKVMQNEMTVDEMTSLLEYMNTEYTGEHYSTLSDVGLRLCTVNKSKCFTMTVKNMKEQNNECNSLYIGEEIVNCDGFTDDEILDCYNVVGLRMKYGIFEGYVPKKIVDKWK